jgi:hypothetical protein
VPDARIQAVTGYPERVSPTDVTTPRQRPTRHRARDTTRTGEWQPDRGGARIRGRGRSRGRSRGETLLVIGLVDDKKDDICSGPLLPLDRIASESFATHELTQVRIDGIGDPTDPDTHHWLAEFRQSTGRQRIPPSR